MGEHLQHQKPLSSLTPLSCGSIEVTAFVPPYNSVGSSHSNLFKQGVVISALKLADTTTFLSFFADCIVTLFLKTS